MGKILFQVAMKRILIFSACNDFNAIELAIELIEQGNKVYFLQCDSFQCVCQHNILGNPIMCLHCKNAMSDNIRKLDIIKNADVNFLSDIITPDNIREAENFSIDFNSVKDIKNLSYNGAEVGYGAFSSYVTSSRNVMPDITPDLKKYLSFLIKKEVAILHSLERLHAKENFDTIVLHNGRFAQFKPFLEFARLNNIKYICTEQWMVEGKLLKDIFYNDIPQSIHYVADNILKNWEKGDPKNRNEIGKSFFEKRKKGIPAGDKVYIKDQRSGEMPENWDDSVENITIFNSSEDEFLAVNKDYDSYLMFPNQYIALATIFEHYKEDTTKHFYLRIHPNLKNVPYKSHLALYELKYDNVTIIPADSTISSYTLLDNSDKIIIFNSTMGVEAEYWGKPVIALTKYFYWVLNMLYYPKNVDEVWELIDDKFLPAKKSENLIKYGYWLLHPNYPEISRVPYKYVKFRFMGREFTNYSIMKFLGSYNLDTLFERVMNRIKFISKFKEIPCTKPYNQNGEI